MKKVRKCRTRNVRTESKPREGAKLEDDRTFYSFVMMMMMMICVNDE